MGICETNQEYYEALADRIVFRGLREEEVGQFATYRPGKTWRDLVSAVQLAKQRAIGRSGEALLDGIAFEISEILDIDTNEELCAYEQKLKGLHTSKSA